MCCGGAAIGPAAGVYHEQDSGYYRIYAPNEHGAVRRHLGPHSWKILLYPPTQLLWRAKRSANGVTVVPEKAAGERCAFLGVQDCELHAIAIPDRVSPGGPHVDSH